MMMPSSTLAAPNLWTAREKALQRETMAIDQRCTLTFKSRREAHVSNPFGEDLDYWVELPLANTLFQNGMTSTLRAQRWKSIGIKDSQIVFALLRSAALPEQSLDLNFGKSGYSCSRFAMHCPSVPITPPREIAESMGNIITRLKAEDSTLPSMSASEELETAVASIYAGKRFRNNKQFEIWALVTPRERWKSQPTRTHSATQQIQAGSRFHRVLSGGGGWGDKKGLLSLDPDPTFSRQDQAWEPDYELMGESTASSHLFDQVVRRGDVVQFYSCIAEPVGEIDLKDRQSFHQFASSRRRSLCSFGTTPSSVDTPPSANAMKYGTSADLGLWTFHHLFGALSEQGISFGMSTSPVAGTKALGAQKFGPVVLTKLPPFSQVLFIT